MNNNGKKDLHTVLHELTNRCNQFYKLLQISKVARLFISYEVLTTERIQIASSKTVNAHTSVLFTLPYIY